MKTKVERKQKGYTGYRVSVQMLCVTALCMALVCVATMVIQIPIPLGYAHLGDSMILLTSVFVGPMAGMVAGGVGSALADGLTGWPVWILPTLMIKGLMGWVVAKICVNKEGRSRLFSVRMICAVFAGMIIMVIGYVMGGAVIYGSLEAGLASAPGLALKGILNIVVFYVLAETLDIAYIRKWLR